MAEADNEQTGIGWIVLAGLIYYFELIAAYVIVTDTIVGLNLSSLSIIKKLVTIACCIVALLAPALLAHAILKMKDWVFWAMGGLHALLLGKQVYSSLRSAQSETMGAVFELLILAAVAAVYFVAARQANTARQRLTAEQVEAFENLYKHFFSIRRSEFTLFRCIKMLFWLAIGISVFIQSKPIGETALSNFIAFLGVMALALFWLSRK